ncbi:MAG: MAPEG family protein [Alphaproteobacteria bacterium]
MSFPIITATLAAFLIILQQALMLSTGLHRAKAGIGVGLGDDPNLERKVRRHGNLAENAAILLIGLGLVEMYGAPTGAVMTFAIIFGVARLGHAIAFSSLAGSHGSDGSKLFVACRAVGATGTALGGIAMGVYLAYLVLS